MGRDLQFLRTDRAIVDAVLRLLQRTSIEKITISDITTEALINRSTFYQHYPDKYAVLETLQKKYIEEMLERTRQVQRSGLNDFVQIDTIFGSFFDEHREVLRLLLSVHTETFDLHGELEKLLKQIMNESPLALNGLECDMLAALWMRFFEYYLKNEKQGRNYSALFFQSCFDIALTVFGIADRPDSSDRLLALIRELTLSSTQQYS